MKGIFIMNAQTKALIMAIEDDLIVKDDMGKSWYYGDGRIRLAIAELEMSFDANGYNCDSFESGVKLLREFGYIS